MKAPESPGLSFLSLGDQQGRIDLQRKDDAVKRFSSSAVGVLTGSIDMFSAFEDDGPMWAGQGPRMESRTIRFQQGFLEAPVVHVSLTMWDIDRGANQRADIQAVNVSRRGFEMQFRTWGDTRVARVRASWLAIGPVRHEDDWDID